MITLQTNPLSPFDTFLKKRSLFILLLLGLTSVLALSVIAALALGIVPVSPEEAYHIVLAKLLNLSSLGTPVSPSHMDIIWEIRLPRVLMSAIVGAGLALCGTVLQASVQNPLAEPSILGISAGASLGAAFSILFGSASELFGSLTTPFCSFLGAVGASFFVLLLSGIGGQMSTVKMVLSGTITSALFLAITNGLVYFSGNAEGMRSVAFWTMGSLAAARWENLPLPATGVAACSLFFLLQARILNTLLLGDEAAITLGMDLNKIRRLYLVLTALITGLIVSVCGIFAFVGLIIPHIVRGLTGPDHRRLLPGVLLTGAIFLIWADVLARIVLPSGELPIGIITSLIGAPFFMYILFKHSFNFGSK